MFNKYTIDYKENIFKELSNSIQFENIISGRQGANIVDYNEINNLIPLVRTTTIYNRPNQKFKPIHYDIINNIKNISGIPTLQFNNALVEIYDEDYCKMGFHSDQSLDLEEDSYICLYSCYENPEQPIENNRKLIIQNKTTKETSEIILEHNSFIIFSTKTNQEYVHKIILDRQKCNNKTDISLWLGITFRLSKTFIYFKDNTPYFYQTNIPLRLSTYDERREFAKHKGIENQIIGYRYPYIDYTISIGDMYNEIK